MEHVFANVFYLVLIAVMLYSIFAVDSLNNWFSIITFKWVPLAIVPISALLLIESMGLITITIDMAQMVFFGIITLYLIVLAGTITPRGINTTIALYYIPLGMIPYSMVLFLVFGGFITA
jgi:hypothetical protein